MRMDDLVRGFGEISDGLVAENLRIEEEALRKKRKGEKTMKRIIGITTGFAAAAAVMAAVLFPGMLRPKVGTSLESLNPVQTTHQAAENEEFSSAMTPTMDVIHHEELTWRGKVYQFEGFIEAPQNLEAVGGDELAAFDGALISEEFYENGRVERPMTVDEFTVYTIDGREDVLILYYQFAWLLYRTGKAPEDNTAPAPVETEEVPGFLTLSEADGGGKDGSPEDSLEADDGGKADGDPEAPEDKADDPEASSEAAAVAKGEAQKDGEGWVKAGTMQQLDSAQFLYTETDDAQNVRVRILPLLYGDEVEAVDWVLPGGDEMIGKQIARLGDCLYFVRYGGASVRLCRKSFTTQEEEVLYIAASDPVPVHAGSADPALMYADGRQPFFCASLLAVREGKILFAAGSDDWNLNVFLYDEGTGVVTDLGYRGMARLVSADEDTETGETCFTFNGGSQDVSASKLWVIREDGEVLLDKWSFTSGTEDGCLYYRDDPMPGEGWGTSDRTVSIRRYTYADGTDEPVYEATVENPLWVQLRSGLVWTYDGSREAVFSPENPLEVLELPGSNGVILKIGGRYCTIAGNAENTGNDLYFLDLEAGECVRLGDCSADYGYSDYLYDEDADVLICRAASGFPNAGGLVRMEGVFTENPAENP